MIVLARAMKSIARYEKNSKNGSGSYFKAKSANPHRVESFEGGYARADLQRGHACEPALPQSQIGQSVDAGRRHRRAALASQQGKVGPGALLQKFL